MISFIKRLLNGQRKYYAICFLEKYIRGREIKVSLDGPKFVPVYLSKKDALDFFHDAKAHGFVAEIYARPEHIRWWLGGCAGELRKDAMPVRCIVEV